MIHIINDWYLDADDKCFVLKRKNKNLDKLGKEQFSDYTYHSDVYSAINYLFLVYQRNETKETMELSEYLKTTKSISDDFGKILQSVMQLVKVQDV